MPARSILARVCKLEKAIPQCCPACAGRPDMGAMAFLYNGVFQTAHGVPIPESSLEPCSVCGMGGLAKVIEGVDPSAMLGVKVVRNVDPVRV